MKTIMCMLLDGKSFRNRAVQGLWITCFSVRDSGFHGLLECALMFRCVVDGHTSQTPYRRACTLLQSHLCVQGPEGIQGLEPTARSPQNPQP